MNNAYIDFDASNDHIRIDMIGSVAGARGPEGIALDSRATSGGHRWSDEDWQGRVDLHLRWADNLAQLMGSHVRYNQAWCERRAKQIGAWHREPKPCAVHDGPDRETPNAEACGLGRTARRCSTWWLLRPSSPG